MRVRVHAALFPKVRLLAVSEQITRSATLTVAVTHPGTCILTNTHKNIFFINILQILHNKQRALEQYASNPDMRILSFSSSATFWVHFGPSP